ncbi:hypothetical protein HFP57_09705 [Parasphingopyxis algicola]|uniref:hypothetical protein n=1 Tax=Parasphingopyxis algicola TaxID=2026624 RepID=UPI0015A07B8C|nr:hypothetical protein [Parasphingopyxis algicola]QLC25267.1 hypothetical protein HFP57_09705 [Parasphingopyxis algicola]
MFANITTKTRLVLAAFALPAMGMTAMAAPASAQSEAETMSAQQRAESFIAALNGSSGERSRWARDNLLSDGSYRMRVQEFNRIARRTGDLELLEVAEIDNGMVLRVRNGNGRTHAISVIMDDRRPDKVLGIGMRGL